MQFIILVSVCVAFLLDCITFFNLFPYISGCYWILMLLSSIAVVCSGVTSCTELVRIVSLLPFRSLIYVRINTNIVIKATERTLQNYKMFFHFDHKSMTFLLPWLTISNNFAIYNSFSVIFLSSPGIPGLFVGMSSEKCQNITNLGKERRLAT